MARINVDLKFFSDVRIVRLARECNLDIDTLRGKLLNVWQQCYVQISENLSKNDIDEAARYEGFTERMLCVGLLKKEDMGIYRVCGADERIDYLRKNKKNGALGGKASGKSRRAKGRLKTIEASSEALASRPLQLSGSTRLPGRFKTIEASSNPPSPVPAPSPVQDPDHAQSPDPVPAMLEKKDSGVCDSFEELFKIYPKQLGRQKALEIFTRSVRTPEEYSQLRTAINNYKTYCQEKVDDPRYIKQFDSFMFVWRDWVVMPKDAPTKEQVARDRAAQLDNDPEIIAMRERRERFLRGERS